MIWRQLIKATNYQQVKNSRALLKTIRVDHFITKRFFDIRIVIGDFEACRKRYKLELDLETIVRRIVGTRQ